MTNRTKNFILVFGSCSALGLLLLTARIYWSHQVYYLFLVWNLFLAWIPFLCAIGLEEAQRSRAPRPVAFGLLALWLLFFPNSPYIITDLFHLHHHRSALPLWFDLALILCFAWTGLMLGYASLFKIHRHVSARVGPRAGWMFAVAAVFLCAYGIYLGRFERWNSWEVLSDPAALFSNMLDHLIHPMHHTRMIGVTLIFGSFLMMGYVTLFPFSRQEKE
ncbi:MAG: DUF1361 domain-containing protein [Bacteroidota bacterium]